MAKGFLDKSKITITCPNCSHRFEESFGRLKTNPKLVCSNCGRTIQIEGGASLDQAGKTVDDGIADLRKTIKKFNKDFG